MPETKVTLISFYFGMGAQNLGNFWFSESNMAYVFGGTDWPTAAVK